MDTSGLHELAPGWVASRELLFRLSLFRSVPPVSGTPETQIKTTVLMALTASAGCCQLNELRSFSCYSLNSLMRGRMDKLDLWICSTFIPISVVIQTLSLICPFSPSLVNTVESQDCVNMTAHLQPLSTLYWSLEGEVDKRGMERQERQGREGTDGLWEEENDRSWFKILRVLLLSDSL